MSSSVHAEGTGSPDSAADPAGSPGEGRLTSADGTPIGYTRIGTGTPVVLVDGALNDRSFTSGPNQKLAAVLASEFAVFTYDRRGRGQSGDRQPYAIEREVEDLQAVIDAAGGSACVYGISSGGALALEAARRLSSISRLALYELPFVADDSRAPIPRDFADHLTELTSDQRRGAAVRYFMTTGVGLPAALVLVMQLLPVWSRLKRLAHTLPYDARLIDGCGAGGPLPDQRWTGVTMPTLVVAGGKSPMWMRHAMDALANALPNAEHHVLEKQMHIVKPDALAPLLTRHFHEDPCQ
jgi:pimeloyl-ACP methyl ester carboxylesterase